MDTNQTADIYWALRLKNALRDPLSTVRCDIGKLTIPGEPICVEVVPSQDLLEILNCYLEAHGIS